MIESLGFTILEGGEQVEGLLEKGFGFRKGKTKLITVGKSLKQISRKKGNWAQGFIKPW